MKKIVALLLATIMVFSCASAFALEYGAEWGGYTPSQAETYSDVPSKHWAFDAVERVSATKWFSGYPDGTFKPNASITRAEAMKVFVTFLGLELKQVTQSTYHDVKETAWYAPYVEAGKKLFPVRTQFNGQTPFQPDMPITREDAMYALVIALKYNDKVEFADQSILNMFTDQNSISALIKPYAAVAVNYGLVSGHADGRIGGQDPLTRAQFATLLYRASTIGFGTGSGIAEVNDQPVAGVFPVSGIVKEESKDELEIEGATVAFVEYGVTVTTDAEGKFKTNVRLGPHTVLVTKDGYEPKHKNITVAGTQPCDAGTIYLKKIERTGIVDGMVAYANDRTRGVEGATVTFSDGTTVTTGADGKYTAIVAEGEQRPVRATKEGFTEAQIIIDVVADTTNYAETMYLAEENPEGSISGTVQDAAIQDGIVAGATLNFREGGDNKTGEVVETITSGADGKYSVTLPSGSYTVEAIKEGYITVYKNVTSTADGITEDISMTPILGPDNQYRVVLTWGETPYDLDSHLTGPKADGTRFHVAYYEQNAYEGNDVVANLDRDDVNSYGPETVTILKKIDGVYRYSIHDYTNRRSTTSDAMSKSGAKVELYMYDTLLATYNMPTNVVGTVWTVFELDGDTIRPINTISNESMPNAIAGAGDVSDDVAVIKNSPEK